MQQSAGRMIQRRFFIFILSLLFDGVMGIRQSKPALMAISEDIWTETPYESVITS